MNLDLKLKKTRKQVFLEQMEQVIHRADLISLIALYYPEGKNGRPPFSLIPALRAMFDHHLLVATRDGTITAYLDVSGPRYSMASCNYSAPKEAQPSFAMK